MSTETGRNSETSAKHQAAKNVRVGMFLGIKEKQLVYDVNLPSKFVYTKMRNTAKGTFLIAISHPFVKFYYWDSVMKGGINATLDVFVDGEVVQQEWKGLWSSNYIAISSLLKTQGYMPYDLIPIRYNAEYGNIRQGFLDTIHVFKQSLEIPLDIRITKDEIGCYNAAYPRGLAVTSGSAQV